MPKQKHLINKLFKLFCLLGIAFLAGSCSSTHLYRFNNPGQMAQLRHLPLKIDSDSAGFSKSLNPEVSSPQISEPVFAANKTAHFKSSKNNVQVFTASSNKLAVTKLKRQNPFKLKEEKQPSDPPWGASFLAILTLLILALLLLTGLVFLFIFIANTWGWLIFSASLIGLVLILKFSYPFIFKAFGNLFVWLQDFYFGLGIR